MKRHYLNDAHKHYSEECLKSVKKMSKHPLSWEEMKAQCDRVKEASRAVIRLTGMGINSTIE